MNEIEFPYLDRKISSDSLEYAKENIWYHLLPYIVAQTDNELQGYKSIISLSLQSSILDELKTQQDKIQYKINALKNRKLNKYLFDLYLYEHQFYEANGGDDTVLMGYTLRDIETILRKDASILILITNLYLVIFFYKCNQTIIFLTYEIYNATFNLTQFMQAN